jgi:RND family efflux transporter MFP subunit
LLDYVKNRERFGIFRDFLVTDAYARGVLSIFDLLDAQNAALVADQLAANAVYDFLSDMLEAERAAGAFSLLMTPDEREAWLQRLAGYFAAPPAEVIRPVRYEAVVAASGGQEWTFAGTARAGVESNLSFKVAGTVQGLAVKVGDRVEKGQLLASLDLRDYELQVQQADAALAQDDAEARNAVRNYDRVRQLYENNNASRNDLDGARARAESAEAAVRSAGKQLELARRQLTYTRLVAPFDCAVASVDAEKRENVRAGQTVVRVNCGEQPEVEVAVPEGLIARIRPGDQVTVRFDSLPGRGFAAEVREVGIAAGRPATTFPVTVQFREIDPGIRPGMAAEVVFRLDRGAAEGGILVVPAAVGEDRDERVVFVVEATGEGLAVARRRPVTVGDLRGDRLTVLEGLTPGEQVVTAGVSRITDGQTVRLP